MDTTPMSFSYVLDLGGHEPGPYEGHRGDTAPILVGRSADGGTTLTSNGRIEISSQGRTWRPYVAPIAVEKSTRLWVRAVSNLPFGDVFTGVVALEPPPAKRSWKASASSFEAGEGNPVNAIDDDPTTFWHTRYTPSVDPSPHSLVVDLGKPQSVGRVLLTPRQDMANGRIRGYAIYLSDDGKSWGDAVVKGDLPDANARQTVRLGQPRTARYLKLVALSEWSQGGYASLAELDVTP